MVGVVLWSTWSELGGATRDVVDVVRGRRGRRSAEPLGTWSTWSELGGAARDVVVVDVVGAQRRRSRAGVVRAGRSRSLCSRRSTKSRAQRRDMSLLVG